MAGWLSVEITYGLYLSDHSILDGIDTELVVLSGIMIQNLARETGWHLRGTRRIGVGYEDVERIQECVSAPSCLRRLLQMYEGCLADGVCVRGGRSRRSPTSVD